MRRRLALLLAPILLTAALTVATAPAAHAASVSILWQQTYGNAYGGNRDVWSNRNPTWVVGTASQRLTFQTDCNFVDYWIDNSVPWASNTVRHSNLPCLLRFQTDGNLVIYQSGQPAQWATNTYYSGTVQVSAVFFGNKCFNIYHYSAGAWRQVWKATTNAANGDNCDITVS